MTDEPTETASTDPRLPVRTGSSRELANPAAPGERQAGYEPAPSL